MAQSPFIVTEHIIDCQYIREYPRATATGDDAALKLVVKRYTPRAYQNPRPGDITIIGAHGSGFPKELYEPMWEELLLRTECNGFRIRSIWLADTANQGASGARNEIILGNDPSWFDHGRDLLIMINQFRADMPRPIIGIGHSMGAGQLVLLSLMHPRLFTSLVLIEPVMEKDILLSKAPLVIKRSIERQDIWPSRFAAVEYSRKLYKRWDPRVLERWITYGFREIPTAIYPQTDEANNQYGPPVTLATTKYQEVMTYLRANFSGQKPLGQPHGFGTETPHDPLFHPDIIGPPHAIEPFYRYEPILAWKLLKHIRPSVLYIFGESSPFSTPESRAEKLERTGTGIGGSGGAKYQRVKGVVIYGAGHHLPLDKIAETSDELTSWIRQELEKWKEGEDRVADGWAELSVKEKTTMSDEWKSNLDTFIAQLKKTKGPNL